MFFLIHPYLLLGLIFIVVEIEECYDLCPMRCLSDGPIQNYDCSYMVYLHIEHNSSTHMVATLDSSLDLSLFDHVH